LINPPTGSSQSLTFTTGDAVRGAIATFTVAAGKTAAFDTEAGTTGSSTAPTQAITPGAQPNLIIAAASHEGGAASTGEGTGQTGLFTGTAFSVDEGVWNSNGSYEPTTSVASDTQSFTNAASDVWAIAVATFVEASVGYTLTHTAANLTLTGKDHTLTYVPAATGATHVIVAGI
jgi:hypothetical protein